MRGRRVRGGLSVLALLAGSIAAVWPIPTAAGLPCGAVAVIDTSTETIVDSVQVGCYPEGIALWTPSGVEVWTTNAADNSSSLINTSTNTVVATIPGLVGNPQGIAFTPATAGHPAGAYAWVAASATGKVYSVDTATHAVTSFDVGSHPYGIAFKPDGSTAYVTDRIPNGKVWVVDIDSHQVTGSIDVLSNPMGVAIAPPGPFQGVAYVADNGSGRITVIDTAADAVVTDVVTGSGPEWVAFTPAGDRALVTNEVANTVSVLETVGHTKIRDIPVSPTPEKVAIAQTPVGLRAYVANEECVDSGGRVTSINLDDPEYATHQIPGMSVPEGVAFNLDGSRVYVTDEFPWPVAC